MTATQFGGFAAVFLASTVEWVEAFTIVLAVALTIGWPRALSAAGAALGVIAALIAVTGLGLHVVQADMDMIRAAIGAFLLLFGLRWYVKAIRRYAGKTPLHDEAEEFSETRELVSHAEGHVAWAVAFKGVLLEGLEVWLLVIALGRSMSFSQSVSGAVAALLAVVIAGAFIHKPLTSVPENLLKFMVACALLSFGTFWSSAGLFGEQVVWPLGDVSLILLFMIFAALGRSMGLWLRKVPSIQNIEARA